MRGGRWWLWGWGRGRSVGEMPPADPREARLTRSALDPLLNCGSRRSGGDAGILKLVGVLLKGETPWDADEVAGIATALGPGTWQEEATGAGGLVTSAGCVDPAAPAE